MKYAIIEANGRQIWVEVGKYFDFNKITSRCGSQIFFNNVLLLNNNGIIQIGKPYLNNVIVRGKILEHFRGNKIVVYKMRPKKKFRKKHGYKPNFTRVLVEEIGVKK